MSNFRSIYLTSRGVGKTGLSPAFNILVDIQTGSTVTFPAIEELSGGFYRFLPELVPFQHQVGVIDAGVSITDPAERFVPVDVRYNDFDDTSSVQIINVFDEDSDSVTFHIYLLINGKVIGTELTSCAVEVFDNNHASLFSLTTTSQTNGVFTVNKATPGFTANNIFYSKATIVTTNETIVSIDSFITLS